MNDYLLTGPQTPQIDEPVVALPVTSDNTDVSSLPLVESAIRERNRKLAEVKEKQKKLNEMLKSYLENSPEYVEASKLAKTASGKKSSIKQSLLSQPGADDLPNKIQAVRDEKKELEESLSYYLSQFQNLSGTNEFEDENGDLKQIVYVAKLVKRSVFEK